jgi:hypothetical protein
MSISAKTQREPNDPVETPGYDAPFTRIIDCARPRSFQDRITEIGVPRKGREGDCQPIAQG